MNKTAALLLALSACTSAITSCPSYPSSSFTWANNYASPTRPADSLLECSSLSLPDPQICTLAPGLSDDSFKHLILNDLTQSVDSPSFPASNSWNSKIAFTLYPPDNAYVHSTSTIKNAWVKFSQIQPILYDQTQLTYYVGQSGSASAEYGFSFVVPNQTFSSDCKTTYQICGYSVGLDLYDNSNKLNWANWGTGSFNANPGLNYFWAALTVNSEYLIQHYTMQTQCFQEGKATVCYPVCTYLKTDDNKDSNYLTDDWIAYYQPFNASFNTFIDSFQNGLIDGWIYYDSNLPVNQLNFTIDKSSLVLTKRQYGLTYTTTPYNVIYPDAFSAVLNHTSKFSILSDQPYGSNGEKIHFLAPAQDLNCEAAVSSGFTQQLFSDVCFYNDSQAPVLNLTVSNLMNSSVQATAQFYDNLTGLPLIGKSIDFTYGNQSTNGITDDTGSVTAEFNYTPQTNTISALFTTDFQTRSTQAYAVIPVTFPTSWSSVFYVLTFFLAFWLILNYLRRQYT